MKTQTASIQRRKIYLPLPLLCLLGLMALPGSPTFAGSGRAADPAIVPVNARFHGLTYGEWLVEWEQWYFDTILLPNSPFMDDTGGAYFATGQSGPVWFLPWTWFQVVDRSITIPAGSSLLFSVWAEEALFQLPSNATDERIMAMGKALLDDTTAHVAKHRR